MDLVDEFVLLTDDYPSVTIFRRWAAITLVSAAMGRKVFSRVSASIETYPNLYTLLVGLPASGKSMAIRAVSKIAREKFEDDHVAPDSLTSRRLTHLMAFDHNPEVSTDHKKDRRKKPKKDIPEQFVVPKHEIVTKMTVFSSEFATFLKEYDQDMMKVLSDLFDCPEEYRHETQHFGQDTIYNAYLTILGGVQPWWFGKLPSTAFEQGFATRLIVVHSADEIEPKLFTDLNPELAAERLALIHSRVEMLQSLDGEFFWYPAAKTRLQRWYSSRAEHAPKHPLLTGYGRRRLELLVRLAMISAASAHGTLNVRLEDLERAIEWLAEAEATMPGALETAGASQYHHHEIALARYVEEQHQRTEKAVTEKAVRRYLSRNIPPNLMDAVINGLVGQGRIITVGDEKPPMRRFLPGKSDE